MNEQIRRNRGLGPEEDRSEGSDRGNTPERAAAASSRESEADPNLLRFGGSATGGSAPPVETNMSARTTRLEGRKRNSKRGMRSQKAKERRNVRRTTKRKLARRKNRRGKREALGGGGSQGRGDREWRASAQEPERADWIEGIWIATLNVDGLMRQGKREEVEEWMKKQNIAFLFLQETHSASNSREARGNYTWYFSGEKKLEGANWTAGVGIVVENKHVQNIADIEPVSDRIIRITLNARLPITLLGIYLPQAGRPEEEGEEVVKEVEKEIRKWKAKGPLYILGDMNARIQRAEGRREREHIGKYTFEPETASSNST